MTRFANIATQVSGSQLLQIELLKPEEMDMARIGISVRIDVTKIEKSRLYKGEKGTYLDLTTFIDTENRDQYDNHGFISQSVTKEEREQNIQTPILGNCKVFFSDLQPQQAPQAQKPQSQNNDFVDDDLPF